MQTAKSSIGRQVISISDGRRLGIVKDVYLDSGLEAVAGVYLGPEGFLSRKSLQIRRSDLLVFGPDAILAKHSNVVIEGTKTSESAKWVRRDRLHGWRVATAGGTRVGTVGDVLLSDDMRVVGFSLSSVQVEGPVEEKQVITRDCLLDTDFENDLFTIDLAVAENRPVRAT